MSKKMLPDDETIIDLYVNKKLNCKQILNMYGMKSGSTHCLVDKLKLHGISIRRDAGENHHNWKGGVVDKGRGYIGIWKPDHPRASHQGYVYAHTLEYEKNTGYLPQKGETIHHIDMDKHNNNFSNLYLCTNRKHAIAHRSVEKLVKELLKRNIIEFKDGIYVLKKV